MIRTLILTLLMLVATPVMANERETAFKQNVPTLAQIYGCDTPQQINAIVSAWKSDGYAAFRALQIHYGKLKNARGQSACGVMRGVISVYDQVAKYRLKNGAGNLIDVYVLLFVGSDQRQYAGLSTLPMIVEGADA